MHLMSIKQVERKLRKIQSKFQKELGISLNAISLLETLYEYDRPINVKQAASELSVCSQAITRMLHQLKGLQFIHVEKSLKDKRVTWISLTERGREVTEQILKAQESFLEITPKKKISTPLPFSENGHIL
jgi:DNA-binding MarR family transcriptional regulator